MATSFNDLCKKVEEGLAKAGLVTNLEEQTEPIEKVEPAEEWVWMTGYKGTDKNMCCRGFQYRLGEAFDMPNDVPTVVCECGFHLCRSIQDVWSYYDVTDGNRFFEVRALVRKTESNVMSNKYVAKTIIFTRELTADEVLNEYLHYVSREWSDEVSTWTGEEKNRILEVGLCKAVEDVRVNRLESLGYSKYMALHIVNVLGEYSTAYAVGTQINLSIDMKVMAIYETAMLRDRRGGRSMKHRIGR